MQMPAVYVVGIGLAVASQALSYVEGTAAASARNSYLEGAAQNAELTGKQNRLILENNARLADQDASLAKALGERRATAEDQKGLAEIGVGKALLASSGVDLLNNPDGESYSAMDYFQQVAQDYKSRAEYENWKGEYDAWTKNEEAKSYRRKGYLAEWEGNSQAWSLRASKSSGPSLLGTALSVGTTVAMGTAGYGKWYGATDPLANLTPANTAFNFTTPGGQVVGRTY